MISATRSSLPRLPRADVLLVAEVICECNGAIVNYFQKSCRTASVLNVRPASRAYRCNVEAVPFCYERHFVLSEAVGFCDARLHPRVLAPAAVSFL